MKSRFIRALLLASLLLAISLGLTVRFEQQQRSELGRVTAFSNQDELWHSFALTREYLKLREIAALARGNSAYYLQLRTRYDIFAGRVAAMQNGAFIHQLIDKRAYGEHMAAVNQVIENTDARWAVYPMSADEIDQLMLSLDRIQPNLQTLSDLTQHGFSDQLGDNEKLVNRLGQTRIALAIFQSLLLLGFAGMALFELRRSLQRERQLGEARSAAQAANEAKSRFLANVSHEMRTPLTSILGYAGQVLKDPALGSESRRQLGLIRRSAEFLASLLGNVLDVSRIEAGRVQLHAETVSLATLAADLRGLFALQAEEKGIALIIENPPETPAALQLDGGKLRQILINLIGNAVKFTSHGEVRVAFSLEQAAERFRLHARVSDSGPGIASEEQGLLFSPFEQTSSGRNAGGSGLGLAISREFSRLMGGDVVCVQSNSAGSVFEATVLADAAPDLPAAPPVTSPAATLRGQHVLVVEDQAINRELLCDVLRDAGATVSAVADGAAALQAIAGRHFDVLLLDFNLPDGDGLALAQQMRTARWQGRIVMLSAALHPGESALAQAQISHWLSKPFDSEHLVAVLASRPAPQASQMAGRQATLLDAQQAMARLGCDEARYRDIAARGLARIHALLGDYSAGDVITRQRLAHSARGIALQIGATALATGCADLEVAAVAGERAITLLDSTGVLLARTEAALAQF
ncbi:Aerobic respiration control sensor protein ArcB [Andreprevotia sp. IGB-42]|uniref:ATP-binding protein n=1 Tax=Andreprevotia sp. IGB-42 TaxID=2497473 RepID=UPI00135BD9A1|nr:ATP-binding protein [Andreprevotia sp. IGB-42]KAF0811855.1 Aerobic respiration control sensor protein ArcB [Andreprevotia sp. IGB-42]